MDNSNLKKNTLSGFIWKFLERIMAQIVSLVVTIVLARILTPADYSVVSIVTVFFAFANVIISGGLNTALIQKKDADEEDFSTILLTCFVLSVVVYICLFFCAPFIAKIYSEPLLTSVFRVMGLILIVSSFKSILCAYVSNHLEFKKFFWATFWGTVFSGIVGITMAVKGFGAWALVAQQMTNTIVDTIILKFVTKYRIRFYFSPRKFKLLFSYGWKVFFTNLLDASYEQASALIIGLKFNSTDLAFYTKGKSFPVLLNSTLSDTFSAVLFPVLSKLQDEKERLLLYLRRFMQLSTYIVFPAMIGFLAVSDNFIIALLTEKWVESIYYVKIFCISGMFMIITKGNLQVVKAIGRSDILLILEIIKKATYFGIIALFVFFSKDARLLALETVCVSIVAFIVNTYPNKKLIGYKMRWQIFDILPNLAMSTVMGLIVYGIGYFLNLSSIVELCIQVISGILIYYLLSIAFRPIGYRVAIDEIKSFMKKEAK